MPLYPKDWGPHGWKFIHIVALAYPSEPTNEDKENYKTFFTIIGKILPCHLCNDHYNENLINYPLNDTVLSSRDNLLKWTIDMHNSVNKSNGTKVYDYDTAIKLIKDNFNDSNKQPIKETFIDTNNQSTNNQLSSSNNQLSSTINQVSSTNNQLSSTNNDNNKKDNTLLYILIALFIILVIIAVIYKKK
jgi:hypothetical protein